jgi:hypothetical protein
MKYRLSPINIFVGISVVALLLSPLFANSDFGGLVLLVYLFPIFIFGMLIDFVLQIFSKNHRRTIIIELVIIIVVLMLNATMFN